MKSKPLEFWFEFASTYSYLSIMRIEAVAEQAGVEVLYRPFLLGPIFQGQGWDTSPFNLYPAKGEYMWKDMARRSKAYGIPFHKPENFPVLSVYAARVALLGEDKNWCIPFIRAVFEAHFVDDQDISDPDILEALLVELGVDGASVLHSAGAGNVKQRLRARTEQAVELGIFGAPSFIVGRELFWGDDRLEDALAEAISTENLES